MNKSNRNSIPLIELIIMIGFFAFASTIIIRLFFGAYSVSQLSTDQNMAILNGQSILESIKEQPTNLEFYLTELGFTKQQSNQESIAYQASFDENWQPNQGKPVFTATLVQKQEKTAAGFLYTYDLSFHKTEKYPFLADSRQFLWQLQMKDYQSNGEVLE